MHRCHHPPARAAVSIALVAALLATALRAEAAPRSREQREAEARKHCAAGRVEAGIEILAELLTEYSHPNYIYNQGRCYQQNGRAEPAIPRFKEYLRAAQDISAEERERVERFIKELEAEVQAAVPAVPAPAPPAETGAAAPTETPVVPMEKPAPTEVRRASPPPRSAGLRTAAIALGLVSLAGLATGVVSTLQVQSLEKEAETAPVGGITGLKLAQNREKARTFETLQWVGYGVGGAALVGAIVCLIMDKDDVPAESAGPRLTGTLGPGGQPGLVLSGRF